MVPRYRDPESRLHFLRRGSVVFDELMRLVVGFSAGLGLGLIVTELLPAIREGQVQQLLLTAPAMVGPGLLLFLPFGVVYGLLRQRGLRRETNPEAQVHRVRGRLGLFALMVGVACWFPLRWLLAEAVRQADTMS